MITIPLGQGGRIWFRMVDSSGAAVTGLMDGDFTQRDYIHQQNVDSTFAGTINEWKQGWYEIQMSGSEANFAGPAAAIFSDGTNEAHVAFQIDELLVAVNSSLSDIADEVTTMAPTVRNMYGVMVQGTASAIYTGAGEDDFLVTGAPTTTQFTLAGPPDPAIVSEESLVGCVVRRVADDSNLPVPMSRGVTVTAYDSGTGEVTVSPAMATALVADESVRFFRPVGTLLDHPDGVAPGFSQARTLRKIGAAVVANNTGAAGAGAGTQTFRNLSDTADEFDGAYDANGNRTITHSD